MRIFVVTLCLGLALIPTAAQTVKKPAAQQPRPAAKPTPKKNTSTAKTVKPKQAEQATPVDDKTQFEKASAIEDVEERAAALKKFISSFPNSALLPHASERLSSAEYA